MTAAEQVETPLAYYVEVFQRRKTQGLIAGGIVFAIALLIAILIPSIYRSSAIILIEQQEIPKELVRSTITSFAAQRIQVISQRVMTSANLTSIMDKYNLYPDERAREPREVVLENFRNDIHLDMIDAEVIDPVSGKPTEATIAFSFAYDNRSPTLAQRVANEVVTLFLNENLRTRTEMVEETSRFLQDEATKLSDRVKDLEAQLATFKEANVDRLPELMEFNLRLRTEAENEKLRIEQQIAALGERKIFLEAQLAQIAPYDAVYSETGQRILGPNDRLKALELELISQRARYGAQHPDVVRLENEVQALQVETGGLSAVEIRNAIANVETDLTEARENYTGSHPAVQALERQLLRLQNQLVERENGAAAPAPEDANNPAYIQIRAQLFAADSELDAARRKQEEVSAKLAAFDTRILQSPNVERDYRGLQREYETSLVKYRDIMAKQMEAQVSQSLETERKGERFTLIEPPLEPAEPAKPNRLAIVLLGFVLSLGTMAGTIGTMESLDDRVRGRRGVIELLGTAPLGFIPTINGDQASHAKSYFQKHRDRILIAAAVILFLLLVHNFYRPLDSIVLALLRRLGIG